MAVVTSDGGTPSSPVLSDSFALDWDQRGSPATVPTESFTETEYTALTGSSSGTDTVTFTYTAGPTDATAVVFGVANVDVSSPFDPGTGIPSVNTGTGTTAAGTSFTTTDSNDMILGLLGTQASAGTVSSLATIIDQVGATDTQTAAMNGTPTSTADTYGLSSTLASSADWAFLQDAVVQAVETTTPTPSPGSGLIDVGQTVTFSTSASGGSGGYSYTWMQSDPDFGCDLTSTADSVTCTPTLAGTYSVSVYATDSSSVSSSTVASSSFVVRSLPTTTTPTPSPSSGGIDVGQTVTFTTSASGGSGGYTYTWTQSSANFGCNVASTAATMACTPTVAGTYTVSVYAADSNSGHSSTRTSSNFVVDPLPTATTPSPSPSSGGIDVGQTVTFTTSASGGSGGYIYAWTQSSTNFGCNVATSAATMACTPTASGTYTVSVYATDTNGGASTTVTSGNFVVDALPTATTPSPSPSSGGIDVSQTVTFTTSASGGSGGYSYGWTQSSANFGCNVASTAATMACTPTVAGSYTVSVYAIDSNGGHSSTKTSASFVVYGLPATTTPSPSPPSAGIDVGQSTVFTTTATGGSGGPYSYVWTQSSANFGCNVASTGDTLACTPTVAGSYTVSVYAKDTNGGHSTTVTSAAYVVDPVPTTAVPSPSPASGGIDVGQTVTFTTSASAGSGGYSYTWTQSSTNFGCNVASTAATMTCTPTAAGSYTVFVYATDSNGGHSTTVPSASYVVDALPTTTTPTPSPSSGGIDVGQTTTFTTSASGGSGGPYGYTWTQSSSNFGCNVATTAATMACTPTVAGTYTVSVLATDSNGGPSSTKTSVSFVVYALPATTTPSGSPSSGEIDVGQSTTFTTTGTGGSGGPYGYTWTQSSSNFGCNVGSTAATMVCTPTTQGSFTVSVYTIDTNGGHSTTVTSASFVVDALPTTSTPSPSLASGHIDVGQSVTFTTTATSGSGGYTYGWSQSLSGFDCNVASTAASMVCTPAAAGTYTVSVDATDSNGGTSTTVTSSNFVVDALPTTSTPSPAPASGGIDVGQAVTFTSSASAGSGGYVYAWTQSSSNFGCNVASTSATMTCTPTVAGSYTVSVYATDSNGGRSSTVASGNFVVDAVPATTTPAPSVASGYVDVDQTVTFTTSASAGSGGYSFTWTQSSSNFGCNVASHTASMTCAPAAAGTYTVTVYATDSNGVNSATVTFSNYIVNSALTAPGAPTISSNPVVDQGQTSTLTGTVPSTGTSSYSWQWLYSTNGGTTYGAATAAQCATPSGSGAIAGATETCSFVTSGATPTGSYLFELEVTDGASTPEQATSSASAAITVDSALTAPSAPTPSATSLDADQPLTVTGTIPSTGTTPYAWQWLIEVNGVGGYVDATQCGASASGNDGLGGAVETCAVPGNTLTASTFYTFELQITDSASSPRSVTSPASATVTTSSALTAGTPTPTTPTLDRGQSVTLMANPSGGSGGDTYQWYSGSSSSACTALGAPISGATSQTYPTSPTSTTYYCYTVTDTNSVTATSSAAEIIVNSALSPPAAPAIVSNPAVDRGQTSTLTATIPMTGTGPYSWEWLYSRNGGASYTAATASQCATPSGTGAAAAAPETCTFATTGATPTGNYLFELKVTDSASVPETQTSSASPTVSVSSSLTAPAGPTPSAAAVDLNQVEAVSGTVPSSGTAPYSWQWLVEVNGTGGFVDATQCTANSGTEANAADTETCSIVGGTLTAGGSYAFELQVTDSASTPETATSTASSTVSASSALTAPAAPTVSATALDVNQGLTVTATIPSTGTPSYSWGWLISINGGAFGNATQCAVSNGTGAAGSAIETCSIAAGVLAVGDTYAFELKATDNASTPVELTSAASSKAAVSSALQPGTPTPASLTIDDGQSITLTANPSGGSGADSYRWYSGSSPSACTTLGSPISGATSSTYSVSPTSGTYYCYVVTDSATAPEHGTSTASSAVAVNSALTSPAAPIPSLSTLNPSQALNVTGTIPSTGTAPYTWQWLISINGSAYSAAKLCALNAGTGAVGGATETCSIAAGVLFAGATYGFELQVTDSATSPMTETSSATAAVTVTPPPSSSSSSFPWLWVYLAIGLVVVAVLLFATFSYSRRRRRPSPPSLPSPPPRPSGVGLQPWEEGPPAGTVGTTAPSGAPAPAYVETPTGVTTGPATVSPAAAGGATAPVSPPAPAGPVPDIDAMLLELEKLSQRLNKALKEGGTTEPGQTTSKEETKSS